MSSGYIIKCDKQISMGWSLNHLRSKVRDLINYGQIFSLSSTSISNLLPVPDDVIINISRYLDSQSILNLTVLNKHRCSNSLCGALLHKLILEHAQIKAKSSCITRHDLALDHDVKLTKTVSPIYVQSQIDIFSVIYCPPNSLTFEQIKQIINTNYYMKFDIIDTFVKHVVKKLTAQQFLDIFEETNSYLFPFTKHIQTEYYIQYLKRTPKKYTFTDFPLLLSVLKCKDLCKMYKSDIEMYYSKERLDTMMSMTLPIICCGPEHVFDNLSDKSRIFDGLDDDRIEPICRILKKKGYNRKILNAMCDLIIKTNYLQDYNVLSTVMVKHDIIGTTKKEKDESIHYTKIQLRLKNM